MTFRRLVPQSRVPERGGYPRVARSGINVSSPVLRGKRGRRSITSRNEGGPSTGERQEAVPTVGEAFFASGNSYRGEMLDGLMHGSGAYTWADGSRYVGDFCANEISGNGEKTWHQGERRYAGQWKNGVFHGVGELVWEGRRQESYSGGFRKGFFHGKRRRLWGNGDSYDGLWRGGEQHGAGTLRLSCATRRSLRDDGDGRDGRDVERDSSGAFQGRLTSAGGGGGPEALVFAVEFCGMWERGDFQGRGTCTWSDGAVYTGQWVAGQMQGHSTLVAAERRTYEGGFADGRAHGQGMLVPPARLVGGLPGLQGGSGSVSGGHASGYAASDALGGAPERGVAHPEKAFVEGQWADGVPHGHARAMWPSGQVFDGEWAFGSICGLGRLRYPPPDASLVVGRFGEAGVSGPGERRWAMSVSRPVSVSASQVEAVEMGSEKEGEKGMGVANMNVGGGVEQGGRDKKVETAVEREGREGSEDMMLDQIGPHSRNSGSGRRPGSAAERRQGRGQGGQRRGRGGHGTGQYLESSATRASTGLALWRIMFHAYCTRPALGVVTSPMLALVALLSMFA